MVTKNQARRGANNDPVTGPQAPGHVSGFASILGRPNAGKSTLLNALVGSKIAIVSSKPQTTRTGIQAVLTRPEAQVVFLDTPGIHEAGKLIHKRMMEAVREALNERDVLLYVCDASVPFEPADADAIKILEGNQARRFLVLNKIDSVKSRHQILPLIETYRQTGLFEEFVPVSALTGEGLDELVRVVLTALPEGPRYFPEDHLTDQPERFLAAELIREAALETTRQEVPHAIAVLVDRWEDGARLLRLSATVYVEREGQKKIVIGTGGQVLKRIGTAARQQIEALLGRKCYLELFVKVRPGWRENSEFLNELDWRYMAGGQSR